MPRLRYKFIWKRQIILIKIERGKKSNVFLSVKNMKFICLVSDNS